VAIFKKNVWMIFYIIFLISLIIFLFLIYKVDKSEYNEFTEKQENLTKITANSINSIFLQYEMVLDILGSQLVKNKLYKDFESSRKLLDNLLTVNTNLLAFALVKENGQIYVTSTNLSKIKDLPNLLDLEETRDTFLKSLNSKEMVIGRTYYSNELKNIVIPIRKAIRDKDGNVIAVIIAGIKVDKNFKLLSDTQSKTVLIRGDDRYIQLLDYTKSNHLKKFYKIQVPLEHLEDNIRKIETKYNQKIDDIQNNENIVTIEYKALMISKNVLASVQYLKRYNLWVISQIEKIIIEEQINKKILIISIFFLIVLFIFYLLIRSIDKFEMKKQKALYYQATHDYLTNLNNRFYLSKNFEEKEILDKYTLFFIDLDNFKNINDNYGHAIGDYILKEVASRLNFFKEERDILARNSGDEFLLIKESINKDYINQIAQKIINKILEPYYIQKYKITIGVSIGIAQYPSDAKNFDELKRYSDIAMYKAKKVRNTYCFFEDSIKHKYLRDSLIEQELKNAVTNNEIYLVYQPQIDKNDLLFGVEALVRWENKKLGVVSPDEFIKIAESTGQMVNIGEHILKTSIKEITEIQSSLNISFQLSINVSVKQFMEIDFYDKFFKIIDKYNIDYKCITLEVTENVFIEDLKYILDLLSKLKTKGIRISLDDFGTGYSSLSLLGKLPIDELKIDRSFVEDVLSDVNSRNMIDGIMSIGKKLDLEVLAEGIETIEQKEFLLKSKCDLFQGYYFSKPLKEDQLKEYVKENFKDKVF